MKLLRPTLAGIADNLAALLKSAKAGAYLNTAAAKRACEVCSKDSTVHGFAEYNHRSGVIECRLADEPTSTPSSDADIAAAEPADVGLNLSGPLGIVDVDINIAPPVGPIGPQPSLAFGSTQAGQPGHCTCSWQRSLRARQCHVRADHL